MNFDLIIRGGTVVTGSTIFKADIGVKGEKVVALGQDLGAEAGRVIDARGKLVLPGGLDVHTHLQLPFCGTVSADDFENGTKAGAMGGVTTLIDFAIQGQGTVMDAVRARRAEADPKVCIDYSLHAGITSWNEERVREIGEIIEYGIPSFKMFMIYKNEGWQSNDGALFGALRESAKYGGMIGVHAENNDVIDLLIGEAVARGELGCTSHGKTRPNFTEGEAIGRAIQMADAARGRLYIFHMSTAEGVDSVSSAQSMGIDVHAETGPQYLLLDDSLFERDDGPHFACCPPIRKPVDQEVLWEALENGTVEVMATDTCTFNSEQKALWQGDFRKIPFGMPGIETMVPITYSMGVGGGRLTLNQMVRVVSENPARLFGLFPEKGTIAVGSDADLVVFDPDQELTINPEVLQTNCDYSPFDGLALKGYPIHTTVRGRVIVEDRKFVGEAGYGKFLHRKPQR